jgi:Dullard-like phosphatase family protein
MSAKKLIQLQGQGLLSNKALLYS